MDRKEKLEEAKRLYKTANPDQKYVLESLFPELAESEDERIRRELIDYINRLTASPNNIDKYNTWIAWLEKQGEKKSIDDLIQQEAMDIAVAKCFEQGENKDIKEHNACDFCEERYGCVNPCPMKLIGEQNHSWSEEDEMHIRELESLVKRVWAIAEHENNKETIHKMSDLSFFLKTLKPQPKQEWGEEDEEHLNSIIGDIKTNMGAYPRSQEVIDIYNDDISFLKSLKDRVQPQPKLKWSEEDEKYTNIVLAALYSPSAEGLYCFHKVKSNDVTNWFISIKDRVQPQQKQEWSDKDEKMIHHIENAIKYDKSRTYLNSKDIEIIDVCNWFKSLRHQSQWKPSDMELEVLRLAAEKDGTCLMGLYEQLKKLREE